MILVSHTALLLPLLPWVKAHKYRLINHKNQHNSSFWHMMNSTEIRQTFLDFFKSKQHTIMPSAPIVVKNDPTLLFTNAGMNQFKDYFLGNQTAPFPRVADTQKCLRVSGKHNDLEEVGVDTYHHTMFEMLGNWSFGSAADPSGGYFKKEAIAWSWELLTEVYKIPREHLYVTVFEGDTREQLPEDDEARQEWKKWIPEERIIPGNKKDNFWEMGDTGPCGPCTEIHVDCRSEEEKQQVDGLSLVNNDHPQVIEIWNNVFIQYNRKKDSTLEPLPAKHVDTGMGLERLVRVLQNKSSNYDTDIFTGIIAATEKITSKEYIAGTDKQSVAFRVLADHIRAISFTIADGQLPSNTGAGYVIRRILRRAVRYYYSYLDYKSPLLHQLLPVIAEQFNGVFDELNRQKDFIGKVIKEEEEGFLRTLDKGLKRIDDLIRAASNNNDAIKGTDAFELLDTFGFPIDLTRLIAAENNLSVDEAGFNSEMEKQKTRSRAATTLEMDDWIIVNDGSGEFVGYDALEVATKILRYRRVKTKGKEGYQLVLERTPFYAESGGQVGDTGTLSLNGVSITVLDTKKENDQFIHFADSIPTNLSGEVKAAVDAMRRRNIQLHHSVTHLMHAALRKVLGSHVVQKGSLVNEEHLRFDYSHFAKTTTEELEAVEKLVNEKIRENIPVVIKKMSKDEAMALGAMALFGEKYGDRVRVVIIDPAYSIELCGGTHAGSTGELGIFKVKHETAVAAGVRRIEAVCGRKAEEYIQDVFNQQDIIRTLLKNPREPAKVIENLFSENASLQKRIESLEARQLVIIRNELMQRDEIINNVTFIGQIIEVSNPDALKKLCFDLKHHVHDHLVVLCSNIGGKPYVAVSVSDTVSVAKTLDASKIIKEHVSKLINGGGGGQKTLATAGGQDVTRLREVIEQVKSLL